MHQHPTSASSSSVWVGQDRMMGWARRGRRWKLHSYLAKIFHSDVALAEPSPYPAPRCVIDVDVRGIPVVCRLRCRCQGPRWCARLSRCRTSIRCSVARGGLDALPVRQGSQSEGPVPPTRTKETNLFRVVSRTRCGERSETRRSEVARRVEPKRGVGRVQLEVVQDDVQRKCLKIITKKVCYQLFVNCSSPPSGDIAGGLLCSYILSSHWR